MPSVINTNIASLNAQRNLGTSQASLNTSIQRLSTGLRVNSAKDDAAGLAIAERMNAQVKGLNVAARNANDGVSLSQTAEGALGQIGDMVQRIRELAVQSSNATNTDDDRGALQQEVTELKNEINRVSGTTNFNGTKLLDGTFQAATFQVGADAGQNITVSGITDARLSGMNTTYAEIQSGTGTATITKADTATATGDIKINGKDIAGVAAAGSVGERQAQLVEAINNASSSTGVSAYLDKKTEKIVLASAQGIDIDVKAGADATTGFAVETKTYAADKALSMSDVKIDTYADAQKAILQADAALKQVNGARAKLGAVQSRFESAVSNIQISSENTSAARSRIMDTDFAAETASMTRAQILQQAGTAMLSQANQLPQQVLSLLR